MLYGVHIPRCTHIKTNGTQCGSPALRGRRFCFFHKNWQGQRIALNAQPASPSASPCRCSRTRTPIQVDPRLQLPLSEAKLGARVGVLDEKERPGGICLCIHR